MRVPDGAPLSTRAPLRRRAALLCAALLGLLPLLAVTPARSASSAPALHVAGASLVDAYGQPVQLHGVNRSGTEYACIQGWGIFDGPSDAASVAAIASWHVNAVRVPLNEDCWLGINGVQSQYAGATYQAAIQAYVATLNAAGIVAILDLHWAAPGVNAATKQWPMPDTDHSITFWSQVAAAYKSNPSVIFDLFNEPFPANNGDTAQAWACLRDGGSACAGQLFDQNGAGLSYNAAGMQQLVNAVRGAGASNVVMVPGLQYTNTLDSWLQYRPWDSAGQLTASWHDYNFNMCIDASCWDAQIAPVLAQVPLITGELGENDCAHGFVDQLMSWLDAHHANYLAWTWDTWDCSTGPALITDYGGTPTAFGAGIEAHYATLSSLLPGGAIGRLPGAVPWATSAVTPSRPSGPHIETPARGSSGSGGAPAPVDAVATATMPGRAAIGARAATSGGATPALFDSARPLRSF